MGRFYTLFIIYLITASYTINVQFFMCLINDHGSIMKNTHSITSGIEKLWQHALYRCAGDSVETLIS